MKFYVTTTRRRSEPISDTYPGVKNFDFKDVRIDYSKYYTEYVGTVELDTIEKFTEFIKATGENVVVTNGRDDPTNTDFEIEIYDTWRE